MQVQSREQLLKVPCQPPFVHYHTMQWESMKIILKMEDLCTIPRPSRTTDTLACNLQVPFPPAGIPSGTLSSFGGFVGKPVDIG